MADAPKILGTDTLRSAYPKLNSAIDNANEALSTAGTAKSTADTALSKSENTQTQLDTIVINGDSSVEAAQARVKSDGTTFTTLQQRLNDSDAQLADISTHPKKYGAKGDGVNDDTIPFQNALDNIPADGVVDLEGKHYAVTGVTIGKKLHLTNGKVTLLNSALKSAIEVLGTVTGAKLSNLETSIDRVNLAATDASGIFINGATDTVVENCHADGSKNDNYNDPYMHSGIYAHDANGVTIIDCTSKNAHKEGIMARNCNNVTYIRCEGYNAGNSGVGTSRGDGLYAENCYGENSGASGLTFNSQNAVLVNPKSKNNLSQNGITVGHSSDSLQWAEDCIIINPMVEGSPQHGLSVNHSIDCAVIGGSFKGIGGDGIKVVPNPNEVGTTRITGDPVIDDCVGSGINISASSAPSVVDVLINGFDVRNCDGIGVRVIANGDTHISDGLIKGVNEGIQVNGTYVGDVRSGTMKLASIKDVSISDTQKSSIVAFNLSELIIDGDHHRNINILNDPDSHVIKTHGVIPGGTAKLPMPNPLVITNNTTKTISSSSKFADIAESTFDGISKKLVFQDNAILDIATDKILPSIPSLYKLQTTDDKYAKVYLQNANQSLANNTLTKVAFNAAEKDTDLMADLANNALICQTPGTYLIWGQINFATNTTGERILFLYKNGTIYTGSGVASIPGVNMLTFTFSMPLAKGDSITLYARQQSGAALDIMAYTNASRTNFAMKRIGD